MRGPHWLKSLQNEIGLTDRDARSRAVVFLLLLIFVAIAPFLLGASLPFQPSEDSAPLVRRGDILISSFAFLLAAAVFATQRRTDSFRPLAVPIGASLALALLGMIQYVPLPTGILSRVAPVNLIIYHETAEVLASVGAGEALRPRVSIAPDATLDVVLLILALLALFVSSAALVDTRGRRRLFAGVLVAGAILQILLAALREAARDRAHGTFANPNHFAGYLEIILAVAFGMLWAEILTGRDRAWNSPDRAERFEKRFLPLAARSLLWGVIAIGIALTQSRGGILSAAISMLAMLALAGFHARAPIRKRLSLAILSALIASLLFVAFSAGASRFARLIGSDPRDVGREARYVIWTTSLDAWKQFPLLGSGLGGFREAFRRVQPRELSGLVEQAHSDPLQLLVTGGSVGAALGVLLFGSLFALLFGAWRRQKHREESAFVLAGLGALLSLTLHSLVEFNFSIPVIPATLACVLGAAWAAGRDR